MGFQSVTQGIAQSDLLIKGAIEAALDDLRKNPWLFEWIFAAAPNDVLTSKQYGRKILDEGREWFLRTKIEVVLADELDPARLPAIGIRLLESTEAEVTLGDISPEDTFEEVPATTISMEARIQAGPFTPIGYDILTGIVTPPVGTDLTAVFPGQVFWCPKNSVGFVIEEVSSTTFKIPIGSQANMTSCVVTPASSFLVASLESCLFRETYQLTLACPKEFKYLYFLYSILTFCLLRYKQDYLEARGFERSTLRATDVQSGGSIEHPEVVWGRSMQITGFVRHYWPKRITEKLDGISLAGGATIYGPGGLKVIAGVPTPPALLEHAFKQGWRMDVDVLGTF